MSGVPGQLDFTAAVNVASVHVGCAVLFAQVIERVPVVVPYRIAVFSVEVRQFRVGAFPVFKSAFPDVTGDGRRMMLAPCVFISFFVVIQ